MIDTLAKTIIWIAEQRLIDYKYQDINSAIHSVLMDLAQPIMKFMADKKGLKPS